MPARSCAPRCARARPSVWSRRWPAAAYRWSATGLSSPADGRGARALYPAEWIVETPAEAAERLLRGHCRRRPMAYGVRSLLRRGDPSVGHQRHRVGLRRPVRGDTRSTRLSPRLRLLVAWRTVRTVSGPGDGVPRVNSSSLDLDHRLLTERAGRQPLRAADGGGGPVASADLDGPCAGSSSTRRPSVALKARRVPPAAGLRHRSGRRRRIGRLTAPRVHRWTATTCRRWSCDGSPTDSAHTKPPSPLPRAGWGLVDETGVRMFSWTGDPTLWNHPVGQAQYAIANLDSLPPHRRPDLPRPGSAQCPTADRPPGRVGWRLVLPVRLRLRRARRHLRDASGRRGIRGWLKDRRCPPSCGSIEVTHQEIVVARSPGHPGHADQTPAGTAPLRRPGSTVAASCGWRSTRGIRRRTASWCSTATCSPCTDSRLLAAHRRPVGSSAVPRCPGDGRGDRPDAVPPPGLGEHLLPPPRGSTRSATTGCTSTQFLMLWRLTGDKRWIEAATTFRNDFPTQRTSGTLADLPADHDDLPGQCGRGDHRTTNGSFRPFDPGAVRPAAAAAERTDRLPGERREPERLVVPGRLRRQLGSRRPQRSAVRAQPPPWSFAAARPSPPTVSTRQGAVVGHKTMTSWPDATRGRPPARARSSKDAPPTTSPPGRSRATGCRCSRRCGWAERRLTEAMAPTQEQQERPQQLGAPSTVVHPAGEVVRSAPDLGSPVAIVQQPLDGGADGGGAVFTSGGGPSKAATPCL